MPAHGQPEPHLVEFSRKRQVKGRHGCSGAAGQGTAARALWEAGSWRWDGDAQVGFTVLVRPAGDSPLEPNYAEVRPGLEWPVQEARS